MSSIDDWRFPDPAPEVAIDEIKLVSKRATALMARNRDSPVLKTDFLRVFGAVEMVAGMEYHHDNFVRLCETKEGADVDAAHLRHEAVAYLNRMGQFAKFATSSFTKAIIPEPKIPAIGRLGFS